MASCAVEGERPFGGGEELFNWRVKCRRCGKWGASCQGLTVNWGKSTGGMRDGGGEGARGRLKMLLLKMRRCRTAGECRGAVVDILALVKERKLERLREELGVLSSCISRDVFFIRIVSNYWENLRTFLWQLRGKMK